MSDDSDLEVVVLDLEESNAGQNETYAKMECEDGEHDSSRNNDGVEEREDQDVVTDSSHKPNLGSTKECEWREESKLEEKVKQLHDAFTGIPRVYIRRVLMREDVDGNVELAKRLLLVQKGSVSGGQGQTVMKTADDSTSKGAAWKQNTAFSGKKEHPGTTTNDELEEKVKQLHDEFTGIRPVYIRIVLTRPDISGNVEHAKRLLSECQNEGFSGDQGQTAAKTGDDSTSKGSAWRKSGAGFLGEQEQTGKKTGDDSTSKRPAWKKNEGLSSKQEQTAAKTGDESISKGSDSEKAGEDSQKKQSGNPKKNENKRDSQQNVSGKEPSKVLPQEEHRASTSAACGSTRQKEAEKKGVEDSEPDGARGNVRGAQRQEDASRGAPKKQGNWRGKKSSQNNRGGQWKNRGHPRGRGGRGQNWQHQRGGRWNPGLGRADHMGRGGRNDSWRFPEGPGGYDQWGYGGRSTNQMGPTSEEGPSYYEEQYARNMPYQAGPAWNQKGYPNERRPRGMDSSHRGRSYSRGGGRGKGMHQAHSREDLSSPETWQQHQGHRASTGNLSRGDYTDEGPREAWVNPPDSNPQQTNADRGSNSRGRRNKKGRARGKATRADSFDASGSNMQERSGTNVSERAGDNESERSGDNASETAGANVPEGAGVNSAFELKKLLIKGLSKDTTSDGLQNFVEVVSGHEVLETVFLGDGCALVTLQNNIGKRFCVSYLLSLLSIKPWGKL